KMSLLDGSTGKRPVEAHWKDKLVSSKDGEFDLIHLTGDASFIDRENEQTLQADDLKVWLAPQDGSAKSDKKEGEQANNPKSGGSRRPDHAISSGNVKAKSREFNLLKAERFVVWFKDLPGLPDGALAPAASPPAVAPQAAPPTVNAPPAPSEPTPAVAAKPAEDPDAPKVQIKKPGSETKQPIDLSARSVETHVFRTGQRTQLHQLKSEGAVEVTQAPSK